MVDFLKLKFGRGFFLTVVNFDRLVVGFGRNKSHVVFGTKQKPDQHDVKEVIRPTFSSFQTDMDGICHMFHKNVIRANL